jgi:uncharacterized beta-barrel protein YwiB (DUF1934 family)
MKKVIISIKGIQRGHTGADEAIELVTDGLFCYNNGSAKFSYMESELTGLEGTKTTFDISPLSVVMTREGSMNSQMIFEEGRKHSFIYDTPFGSTTMGVNTNRVAVDINEHGGEMEVDYVVDYQYSVVGHNHFMINVREQKEDRQ